MSTVDIESEAARCEAVPPGVCIHCRLPIPVAVLNEHAKRHAGDSIELAKTEALFCCTGCEAAYELLHASGLDDFYSYRANEPGATGRPAGSSESFEEFDDPTFEAKFVQREGNVATSTLRLDGIHCRACVWLLERLPRLAQGVLESRLNLHRGTVAVSWDSSKTTLSQIAQRLDDLGYRPYPYEINSSDIADRREFRKRLSDIAIAAAVSGNLMLIAISLYAGWWSGMDEDIERYFRWVSAGLGAIALLGPGRVFFKQAWAGLRAGVPNMDLPIALGLGLGTTIGVVNVIRDSGEIYFDSLGMLVFLLLVGRWIQYRQTRRASEDIRRLYELTPSRARKVTTEGESRWVPASALVVGDRVRVLGNETIPADGVIVTGSSTIDRSLLTGESLPIEVSPGDAVHGGMNNIEGPIELEVTAVGNVSRLGKLIDLVETAALKRTRLVQRADAMGGWFVIVVLIATLVTAVGWTLAGDSKAWDHAIALAIVACPCALGLATPLAIAVSVGRAARQRLLVKGGDTLERLVTAGSIWFDKTGTLTEGKASVRSWVGDKSVIDSVVALESHSNHQAARAITRDSGRWQEFPGNVLTSEVDFVKQGETGGISGWVAGAELRVGTLRYVALEAKVSSAWERWSFWVARHGCTPILVARDGVVVAGVSVGDSLRLEAKEVVRRLQEQGWRIGIVSGDHPSVVANVAHDLGIDPSRALGGLSPEEKVERIAAERVSNHRGSCVMVGDGMNDSAALAAADVGISVQSGAEISLRSADVYFGRSGLLPVLSLLRGARQTVSTIKLGLGVSLMYNAGAVLLAASGMINPLLAAALMPASSLSVLAIAAGGGAFRAPRSETTATSVATSL